MAASHLPLEVLVHCPAAVALGPEIPDCSGLEGHVPQGALILASELGLRKLVHPKLYRQLTQVPL